MLDGGAASGKTALGGPKDAASGHTIVIEIGGLPIAVRTDSPEFLRILEKRYGSFVNAAAHPIFEFNVEIVPPRRTGEEDASVRFEDGRWVLERGDFHAEWTPATGFGTIRQPLQPYAIDAAMRIAHSILLATRNGLLLHAASAVRNGRAFVFAGVSGAGKTTMTMLAPPDASRLTDEVSYVRRAGDGFAAYGTPFNGEYAEPGENISAPLAGVFLLAKGSENRIEPVDDAAAVRSLLECVLFFAKDAEMVGHVFDTTCELVRSVPVRRLTFVPDERVWDLIR